MKKRVLCLVLVFVMLLPTMIVPASAYSTGMPQGIQLFVGPRSISNSSLVYETYTDANIDKLFTACDEFVLNCINGPLNYDMDGNAIITEDIIDEIPESDISSNATLSVVQDDFKDLLAQFYLPNDGSSGCNLRALADAQVDLAKRLIAANSNVTIWFCFPVISFFPCALTYEDPLTEYANYIKSEMTSSEWRNNIRGFYWATETVGWSGKFTTSSARNFDNPHVKLMDAMGDLVKGTYGKEFMWMPYTSITTDTELTQNDVRLGYVANRSTIFDYILMQPGYFTHGSDRVESLRRVAASATNNKVYHRSSSTSYTSVVGSSKVSGAADIGVVMEVDERIVYGDAPKTASFFNDNYYEYILKFDSIKEDVPIVFYSGARPSLMNNTVFNYVKNFLNY